MCVPKKNRHNSVLRSTITFLHCGQPRCPPLIINQVCDQTPVSLASTQKAHAELKVSLDYVVKSRPSCPRCQKLKVEWVFLSYNAVQQWKQTTTCKILHKEFQILKESQVCITHYKSSQLVISVSDGRKQDTSGMGGQWWRKKVSKILSLIQLTIAHINVVHGKIHTLIHVWFTEG